MEKSSKILLFALVAGLCLTFVAFSTSMAGSDDDFELESLQET